MKHMTKEDGCMKKERRLRRIRNLFFILSMFRYGSFFIKGGKIPYGEVVHRFILKNVYNVAFSFMIKPVCEWLWSRSWYEVLYEFSGLPSLMLFGFFSFLIYMKENGGNLVGEKEYKSFFSDFGSYRRPKPSFIFRIKNFIRTNYMSREINIVEKGMELILLRILWGSDELCVDLTQECEYKITDEVVAVREEDIIIIKINDGRILKILQKGEKGSPAILLY